MNSTPLNFIHFPLVKKNCVPNKISILKETSGLETNEIVWISINWSPLL